MSKNKKRRKNEKHYIFCYLIGDYDDYDISVQPMTGQEIKTLIDKKKLGYWEYAIIEGGEVIKGTSNKSFDLRKL